MDCRDPLLGQRESPPALPMAVPLPGGPPASAVPARPRSRSAEESQPAEPPRQPLCELQPLGGPGAPMVSVSAHGTGAGLCARVRELFEELFTWWFVVAAA